METAAPSLLTIGLPADPKAGGKAGASLLALLSGGKDSTDNASLAGFADALARAEATLRTLGIDRLAATAAGATDAGNEDVTAKAAFFKRLVEALDAQIIPAVMPPSPYPIEATPWQQSFTVAVAFDPAVTLDPALNTGGVLEGIDMQDDLVGSAAQDTLLEVTDTLAPDVQDINAHLPTETSFDPIEAALMVEEGSNATMLVPAKTFVPTENRILAPTAPEPLVAVAAAAVATPTVAAPPARTLTPLSALTAEEGTAEKEGKFFNPAAFREFSLKERPSVARERREIPISVLARTVGMEPEQAEFATQLETALLPEMRGAEERWSAPTQNQHMQNTLGEVLRIAETRGFTHLAPSEQVAVRIVQAKHSKAEKITVTLHPAELGKVEVQMHIEADNSAVVKITADSREAFDVLRADRTQLERILQDSGLKLDGGALEFGYRGSENNKEGASERGFHGHGTGEKEGKDVSEQEAALQEVYITSHIALSVTAGVNIRV
jgi:flagellar hook-length control protein FliK